ncbi:MAG: DEAD/DEAH box helicase family protein [Treponema sp.]|nr:DEAD/DEAH box helicase family protein [Treponema sp.]
MPKQLRDYQDKTVAKALKLDGDILITAPTGCGKTFIAEMIMKELALRNEKLNFMFVVPRINLMPQFFDELTVLKKEDFDIIQAENTRMTGKRFILASKDSLDSRLDMIPENLVMFLDEIHEGLKQSFNLVQKIKPSRLFGLTATPERSDGLSFMKGIDLDNEEKIHKYGLFDEFINSIGIREAQSRGYLCELKYVGRNDLEPWTIKSQGVDEFTEKEIDELFDKYNIWGDLVKTYKKYGKTEDGKWKPALGFTNTVKMAEKVAGIFTAAGFSFKVVSGYTPLAERLSLIEAVKTGKINGLVNADLLTYGFNCPEISYIFSCRHIKSRALWVQIIGRGLRPGKKELYFVDHGDSISEFSDNYYDIPFEANNYEWRYDGTTKLEKEKMSRERKLAAKIRKELNKFVNDDSKELVVRNQENKNIQMLELVKHLKSENDSLRKVLAAQYE